MTQETLDRATEAGAVDRTNDSPFDGALAVRLELRLFGTARKGRIAEITTGAEKDMLRLGKAIIVSPALDAIKSADGEMRRWLESRSVPAPLFRSGTRLVKLSLYESVDERIKAYRLAERPRLVDTFISDWPRAVDDAARRLGPQFDASNYPEADEVRAAFDCRAHWLEIGAPKALAKFSADEYERQATQIREAFTEAMEAARYGIRIKLRDLIAKLAERLTPDAAGKRKVFRDSAVENVTEFFDLFNDCDLTNDEAARAIVTRGRALLSGRTAEDFRDDSDFARSDRAVVAAAFDDMTRDLDDMIIAQPSRTYGEDY